HGGRTVNSGRPVMTTSPFSARGPLIRLLAAALALAGVAAFGADPESGNYRGRVLDPDGKPVAGAKLHLTTAVGPYYRPATVEVGTARSDGRFEFTVPKAKIA